ncbi:hypothetical protein GBAR_LOCUS16930 [Geodia barretti]|uniref:Secreted protein n=2 Tax=Geodia barretti TaxID=519541 RepID=A0AA35SGT5_GEOBA|nr:hypothetical protein GBAR_LOCUS16930 [Geodia barretti]
MELCILHAIFLVLSSRDPVCICGVTTCFHMPTAGLLMQRMQCVISCHYCWREPLCQTEDTRYCHFM